ncbi:MAG: UDP-N-acetylmuramate--L-alanine ligase [Candidatus Binatia bacterium]|nr:MAG: UDP-N-acetylmuramate--L-alanine ligase [Candidatus Binatia bacterium]
MKPLYKRARKVHFVGIGGVGMSGIAEVLLRLGYRVSGSDLRESEATRRLASLGARIMYGHDESHVEPDVEVVVISSAVRFSNPEVQRARALKIPVIPRAEMLAELMRTKSGVAVAGTHGKTTTTSLIAAVLSRAGLDPTVVIGGKVHSLGANAHLGNGEIMVAEADESDGSFLLLSPVLAVVTNIDPEHLDFYGTLERAKEAYLDFLNRVPFFGAAVVCVDDANIRALLPNVRKRTISYGTTPDANYVAREVQVEGLQTRFVVEHEGENLGEFVVRMPGRHQALNALAALAVARELEVPLPTVRDALAEFRGIHRRFEVCGEESGVLLVSDYGHHPAEIRATLAAAREGFGRRLVVAFQPHRYTRTRDLFSDFLSAFDAADELFLTEIYPAGESPIEGVSGETLYRALARRGHLDVHFVPNLQELPDRIFPRLRAGDLLLILGAGNIYELVEPMRDRLAQRVAGPTVH